MPLSRNRRWIHPIRGPFSTQHSLWPFSGQHARIRSRDREPFLARPRRPLLGPQRQRRRELRCRGLRHDESPSRCHYQRCFIHHRGPEPRLRRRRRGLARCTPRYPRRRHDGYILRSKRLDQRLLSDWLQPHSNRS